uniref:2-oxoglutarated dependent oxygenase n=1 Tax=Schisandra chinensis TaxID=50507 RepID=A0A8K1MNT4_SCHCH|nr:2-oxoglutarated dependent oxygenase [Schisandra chinensis]
MATPAVSSATAEYDRAKEVKEFDDSKIGVKGLVDAGAIIIPRFFVHPPENLTYLNSSSTKEIPVIDLADVNSDRRSEIVEHIRLASHTWGFFQVINHGIPTFVLDETIAAVKSFNEQPTTWKSEFYTRDQGSRFRFATNFDLFQSKAASWRDTMQVRMEKYTDNIPATYRKEILAWEAHTKVLAESLTELLSEGLGVGSRNLKELCCLQTVGHYYPFCPQPEMTLGTASHSDPGILTVLLQDQIGGLQVKHGEEWIAVNPVAGGLVINVGDFFEIISNDEYKSVEHRVLANNCREPRISIVTFFSPSKMGDTDFYGPLPDLLSPEKPPLYRNFTVGEYIGKFLNKGLDGKSYVDAFRL